MDRAFGPPAESLNASGEQLKRRRRFSLQPPVANLSTLFNKMGRKLSSASSASSASSSSTNVRRQSLSSNTGSEDELNRQFADFDNYPHAVDETGSDGEGRRQRSRSVSNVSRFKLPSRRGSKDINKSLERLPEGEQVHYLSPASSSSANARRQSLNSNMGSEDELNRRFADFDSYLSAVGNDDAHRQRSHSLSHLSRFKLPSRRDSKETEKSLARLPEGEQVHHLSADVAEKPSEEAAVRYVKRESSNTTSTSRLVARFDRSRRKSSAIEAEAPRDRAESLSISLATPALKVTPPPDEERKRRFSLSGLFRPLAPSAR